MEEQSDNGVTDRAWEALVVEGLGWGSAPGAPGLVLSGNDQCRLSSFTKGSHPEKNLFLFGFFQHDINPPPSPVFFYLILYKLQFLKVF